MKQSSLDIKREALITASIPFVLKYGWNDNALSEACVSLGEDTQYWGMFFANISGVVEFFETLEDLRMMRVMAEYEKITGVRKKIGSALFERIVHIVGGVQMLKRLEEFYCDIQAPVYAPLAAKNIWQTVDVIWRFAGDKSTDFNYYTKRTLLAGVYVATVRRMLRNDQDMRQYITDALDKVVEFGNLKKNFKFPKLEDIPILRMFING